MTICASSTRRYLPSLPLSRTMQRADAVHSYRTINKPWTPSPKHSATKTCDASRTDRVMLATTDWLQFSDLVRMQDQSEAENRDLFESQWPEAQPIVRHYIMGLIGRRGAIDEIVQEVAFICLRRIATFDKTRSFTAWAIGVARLEVFTHRRQQVLLSLDHFPELEVTLSDAQEHLADLNDLRQNALPICLERLSDQCRTFIDLRYGQNQSHEDMAERMRMSINAIKTTLTRIRAQLRECVEHRLSGTGAP